MTVSIGTSRLNSSVAFVCRATRKDTFLSIPVAFTHVLITELYQTEKSVIEGWIKSPGHCKNIMNPAYKEIGAARKGNYWTLVLGAR